ncbi:MAG: GT4 family glycosyltransferase PelF [bacterium]
MGKKIAALQLRSALGFFGAENVVLEIAKGMRHTRYRPIVGVLTGGRQESIALAEGAQQHGIEHVIFEGASPFDRRTIAQIRRFILTHNVGVVHPHGYKADVYAWAATQNHEAVRIATCHPWTETSYSMRARLYAWLDKSLLRRFDHVVAISQALKKEILHAHIPAHKVSVIPNGVDIERFKHQHDSTQARRRHNLPPGHVLIGAVGRLVPEKAFHLLIEAASQLRISCPRAFFIIAGDGPLRAALENEISRQGLSDRFRLLGVCPNIPEVLGMLDFFVLSSVSEGMPMVILEAMAAGKPVVATNVGEIPSILPHGECGLIAVPSAAALSQAVLQLVQDPQTALRLARNAYERVRREYSSEKMAQAYAEVYDHTRAGSKRRKTSYPHRHAIP